MERGVDTDTDGDKEAQLLGYALSQEISGAGGLVIESQGVPMGGTPGSVEDPDYGQDYWLGEIANRSFNDPYGIWENGPQIFPTQRQGMEEVRRQEYSGDEVQGRGVSAQPDSREEGVGAPEKAGMRDPEAPGSEEGQGNVNLHIWAERAWEKYLKESKEKTKEGPRVKEPGCQMGKRDGRASPGDGDGSPAKRDRRGRLSPTWSELDRCFENGGLSEGSDLDSVEQAPQYVEDGDEVWVTEGGLRTQGSRYCMRETGRQVVQGTYSASPAGLEYEDSRGGSASPTWSELDRCFEEDSQEKGPDGNTQEAQEMEGDIEESGRVQSGLSDQRGLGEATEVGGPRPRFIEGLYQDPDLREERIAEEEGLTFEHTESGDVHMRTFEGGTTIPERYPPMSATTVDWSILYRAANAMIKDKGPQRMMRGGEPPQREPSLQAPLRIRLNKGRYSRKGNSKRRGGKKGRAGTNSSVIEALLGEKVQGPEASPDRAGEGSGVLDRAEEREGEEEEEERAEEEDEETTGGATLENEETTTRKREPKTRSRRAVVVIREGRIVPEEDTPARGRRARKSRFLPRRDEIITQEMADPNRTNSGYHAQEDLVASARTSGVFWCNSRTRDRRQLPGTTKKTLLDRASNPSSPRERNLPEEDSQDPSEWSRVSPLDIDPG